MKKAKFLNVLLLIWGIATVISVLVYALTGVTFWATVNHDGDGFTRLLILVFLHIVGFLALAKAISDWRTDP